MRRINADQVNVVQRLYKERELMKAKLCAAQEEFDKNMEKLKAATGKFDMKQILNVSTPLKGVKGIKGLPK